MKKTMSGILSAAVALGCLAVPAEVADKTALSASAIDENASGLVINEVCTSNTGENGNLADVIDSKGKYSDWVELYNPTDNDIDLSGLFITDDMLSPAKAALPDGAVIKAHGYYVVYCGKNISTADHPDKAVALFGLSANGEIVSITDGENAIDTVEVPALADDLTYARVPSGSDSFAVCTPSALAENSEENICKPAAPEFSKQSGSFSAAFQLTLSAEDGAKIYYTTDGSTPTEASTEYSGAITVKNRTSEPNVLSAIDRSKFTDWYSGGWGNTTPSKPTINVDKGTVIRAIAVKDGKSSEVSTVSYFVGIGNKTYDNVPIISIVTDSDNLFDPETGIYMKNNASNKGKEWERPVHIDFIENETVQLSQDCGMRIQGGYSRGDYQKSLRFYARGSYGADKFDYPIISGIKSNDGEGREVNDFEKFVLRNGGNDANYTKFKDSMLQSLVSDMKISTQEGRACIAFINGEYWGVYTLQEDYTDSYVKDHYDVKKKNVVIIKPDTKNNNAPKVDEGNDEDVTLWTDDMDWIYSADLSKADQYKTFTEKFDPESLADYFAVEIYITNEDWSGKNWTVWRSREAEEANPDYSDCRWRFMLYDTEMGANLWGNAGECSTNNKLVQIYQAGRKYNDPVAVLFYKAMQNPQFVSLFKNSMNTAAKAYSSENYKAALAEYKAQYYNNLEKYYQRFPTGNGIWTADQGIKWMNDFFLGSSPREKYYTVMLESLDLIQKYDTLNTANYTAESISDLKKAYDSLITTTTRTGSSQSSQQSKIEAFNQAYHGLTLKSDPTSGHTPSSVWTIDKTATCTRTGSKSRHCTVCGAKTNVTTIPKKAHTYKTTIVPPTYEAQGYTLHKCSVCGSSYKDSYTAVKTVPALKAKTTYTCTTNAVRINWNKVSGVTGYKIYRYNPTTKKWVALKAIYDPNVLTYKDSGLKAGTVYKYRVKAFVKSDGKFYFGKSCDTITTATRPAAATVTKANKTSTAVRLFWKNVTCTGYKIQRYNASTKKWVTVKYVPTGTTNYKISGLKKNTSYKFRILAYRYDGKKNIPGAWSYYTVKTAK